MKKVFVILLSLLLLAAAYTVEGGAAGSLLVATSFCTLFLGVLITSWYTFSWTEISDTFHDAFSPTTDPENIERYRLDSLLVKNLESLTTFWSLILIIMAVIYILSTLTDARHLGQGLAMGLTSLLYGCVARALLFIPMRATLNKKIMQAEHLISSYGPA